MILSSSKIFNSNLLIFSQDDDDDDLKAKEISFAMRCMVWGIIKIIILNSHQVINSYRHSFHNKHTIILCVAFNKISF